MCVVGGFVDLIGGLGPVQAQLMFPVHLSNVQCVCVWVQEMGVGLSMGVEAS